ncbi:MAG: CBS domain-containing protein [Candidatus Azotimanducaceae bacterium]
MEKRQKYNKESVMPNSVAVRDYMTKPVSVDQNLSVSEAAEVIMTNKLSGVTVIDDKGDLVGMLSELDCLGSIVDAAYNGGVPGAAKVSDIMTKNVETNSPDEDIITVAASMLASKHRRRPVIEDGKLVGQLTCRIILGAVKDFKRR